MACLLYGLLVSCAQSQKKRTRFTSSQCPECHQAKVQEFLAGQQIHKPVKEKNCYQCHENHGFIGILRLWEDGKSALCFRCHKDLEKTLSKPYVHTILGQGKCTPCHDPHASDNPAFLKKSDQEACFTCHDQRKFAGSFIHKPLETGCRQCHLPHASDQANLLRAEEKVLCLECHQKGKESFKTAHQGYSVENNGCTGCHNPHSSENPSLLKPFVHQPMISRECDKCHYSPKTPDQLKFHGDIEQICSQCHDQEKFFPKVGKIHQPLQERSCLSCHAPHASSRKALLSLPEQEGCFQCHQKIREESQQGVRHKPVSEGQCSSCHDVHQGQVRWNKQRQTDFCNSCHASKIDQLGRVIRHQPFQKGECTACHAAHGSANKGLLKEASPFLCYQCHKREKEEIEKGLPHTPVGQGQCLDCHQAHLAEAEHLLPLTVEKICWKCHQALQKQLEGAYIHPLTKSGQCLLCHDPHVGKEKNMLGTSDGQLCLSGECHQPIQNVLTSIDRNIHPPLSNLECRSCHNPHGSKVPHHLLSKTETLCFSCHNKDRQEKGQAEAFKAHQPWKEGKCLDCHQAHDSKQAILLKGESKQICLSCHNRQEPAFQRAHGNITFTRGECLDCHAPHYAQGMGLFHENTHQPFKTKECKVCHPHEFNETKESNEPDTSGRHRR